MANDAPASDPYDAVLADLKAKLAQLKQAIAVIEAVRSGQLLAPIQNNAPQSSSAPAQIVAGSFHGLSIVEAVKQLLTHRKKPLGTPEITESIIAGGVVFSTDTPGNTVGSVLHRESAKPTGGIISVGRGTWALPEWYSNPGRFRKKAPGEKADDEPAPDSNVPKPDQGWGKPA
jgi:hypothetical protein